MIKYLYQVLGKKFCSQKGYQRYHSKSQIASYYLLLPSSADTDRIERKITLFSQVFPTVLAYSVGIVFTVLNAGIERTTVTWTLLEFFITNYPLQ